MAREFSIRFYRSKEWKKVRKYVYERDRGLCQDCLKHNKLTIGEEVHHIEYLTPYNINDPNITINPNNLVLLCKDCHHKRHDGNTEVTKKGLKFNQYGELVKD